MRAMSRFPATATPCIAASPSATGANDQSIGEGTGQDNCKGHWAERGKARAPGMIASQSQWHCSRARCLLATRCWSAASRFKRAADPCRSPHRFHGSCKMRRSQGVGLDAADGVSRSCPEAR